uniref:Phospholipase C/D domain-containing protein n=1 Tax=Fervidobacterium pennivorans TaxID=93466 RepID=A0A7V4KDM8_FERPE
MLTREINRYSEQRGAEYGAAFWVEEAKSAYQRQEPKWVQYLGWAAHYLADALCPPHTCFRVNEKGERVTCDFWAQRDGLFSRELRFEMMSLDPFINVLHNPGFDVSFQDGTDILNWIVKRAREIAEMPLVPEFPYLKDLNIIFSWISSGIRGLYKYVTQ